jgi:hypothetical protein
MWVTAGPSTVLTCFEADSPPIKAFEEAGAGAENQRHDRDIERVHQPRCKLLTGDRRATSEPDELEARSAVHRDRLTRVVG